MHSMDSNDTLDRWLQTVSDDEAVRALTHALAVVKVRAELRHQQLTQQVAAAVAMVAPVEASSLTPMRESTDHTLAASLTSQLQPEAHLAQSRIAVPVQEPAVEVEGSSARAKNEVPSVVVASEDELANANTMTVAMPEVVQAPVPAIENDKSVADTFNRATAKTLVFDRETLEKSAHLPVDQVMSGKTMQFGTLTPVPSAEPSTLKTGPIDVVPTKTLLFSSMSEPVPAASVPAAPVAPRRHSVEEQLLVPQSNKLLLGAVIAAGALLLVGLGALVAAVLSEPEAVVVAAPVAPPVEVAEPAAPKAVAAKVLVDEAVVAPTPTAPPPTAQTPTAMSPEQTDEAIARARMAAEAAIADAKRQAAAEEAARLPKLRVEPVVEPKKVTRVAEPLRPSVAPAPIVAASPSKAPPAAAPAVVAAPAPAPAPKKSAAPPPAARKSSADPLDSRR